MGKRVVSPEEAEFYRSLARTYEPEIRRLYYQTVCWLAIAILLGYVVFPTLLYFSTRIRQNYRTALILEAVADYAGSRPYVIEDSSTSGHGKECKVVIDWQDDDSPHTCTLTVHVVGWNNWTVTDEECQGN